MKGWYFEKGPESDVVISSRIRLARNIKKYPFPYKMNKNDRIKVLQEVKDAILPDKSSRSKNYLFVDLNEMTPFDRLVLMEKHLISPELVNRQEDSAVIISKDEKVSIMINEEDHIRIQSLSSGMQLENAWKQGNKIDSILEEKIDFAFNEKYGYLTCCPTNLGTGIRASAMLHLPALIMTGYINRILEACSKLGIAVRGMYGENSEASGNMFQISNQTSLGQSEEEIINNIKNITSQIIEQERMLRTELYKQNPLRFEDKVCRSLGILSNARIMSSEESLKLLSDVRLGVDMGIIENISIEALNGIMLLTQPGNLQKQAGVPLDPDDRDIKRSEYIRERLNSDNRGQGTVDS